MDIAFIITKSMPQRVFEIKLNPSAEDISTLEEHCKARGEETHMVVWLDEVGYFKLANFMR